MTLAILVPSLSSIASLILVDLSSAQAGVFAAAVAGNTFALNMAASANGKRFLQHVFLQGDSGQNNQTLRT
jgi:hypothetical protein